MKRTTLYVLGMLIIMTGAACRPAATPIAAPTAASLAPTNLTPIAVETSTRTPRPTATPAPTLTPSGPFPIGTYKALHPLYFDGFRFRADGTYTVHFTDGTTAPGTYVVSGDKIVMNPGKACIGYPREFTWAFDGRILTFKFPKDNCPIGQHGLEEARQWLKQP